MIVDSNTIAAPRCIDYDLHGIVGIRLLDAATGDLRSIAQQLGLTQSHLARDPDITIRFVDTLKTSSKLTLMGTDDSGFTNDAFLVLRSKHKSQARVQINLSQVGNQCEILCERGLRSVPLLIPILNLTALGKGTLPLHASAFTYNGCGCIATGWSKGGKTETLLAFMAKGAEYIGDEWVYVSNNGKHIFGIPEPIRVWEWHLNELPKLWALVGGKDRTRLRTIKLLQSVERVMSARSGNSSALLKAMRRIMPLLKRQMFVDMTPDRLFQQSSVRLSGKFDRLFFVASHEDADVTVRPMKPDEVARRMVFSLQHERQDFMSYYMKFRFAFPDAANALIDNAEDIQRQILLRVLANKPTFEVMHPYPVAIPALFDAISPLCS